MKVYKIPEDLRAIVFDIDGTLYTSSLYVFEQVDAQVRHFAHIRGMSEDQAREQIRHYRKTWSAQHGGRKISLGNTLTAFGISIQESIEWRNTLLEPERFLKPDPELRKVLIELGKKYKMVCVTNNPVPAAVKTLRAIGVEDILTSVIGLDTCLASKPNRKVLEAAVSLLNVQPEQCLSVGDRYDIDLALPLEMGMGAVLVSGAEDVYNLPTAVMNP